jgi:hypothetical protein
MPFFSGMRVYLLLDKILIRNFGKCLGSIVLETDFKFEVIFPNLTDSLYFARRPKMSSRQQARAAARRQTKEKRKDTKLASIENESGAEMQKTEISIDFGKHRELIENYTKSQHEFQEKLIQHSCDPKGTQWSFAISPSDRTMTYVAKCDKKLFMVADVVLIGRYTTLSEDYTVWRWGHTFEEIRKDFGYQKDENPLTEVFPKIPEDLRVLRNPCLAVPESLLLILEATAKNALNLEYIQTAQMGPDNATYVWGLRHCRFADLVSESEKESIAHLIPHIDQVEEIVRTKSTDFSQVPMMDVKPME